MIRPFFNSGLGILSVALLAGCASLGPVAPPSGELDWRPPYLETPRRPRLAIAFGSGAQRGYAHIGVIRAFEKAGIRPDAITGTSIGAIVGGLWAAGLTSEQIEKVAIEFSWNVMSDWSPMLWQLSRGSLTGLAGGRGIMTFIRNQVGNRRIEELPIPFAVVTTDLHSGERIIINHGELALAVRASAGVPLALTPVKASVAGKQRELVDGSLVEPIPIDCARDLGATTVIAVDVGYHPEEASVRHPTAVLFQTLQITQYTLRHEQLRRADWVIHPALNEELVSNESTQTLIPGWERKQPTRLFNKCAKPQKSLQERVWT